VNSIGGFRKEQRLCVNVKTALVVVTQPRNLLTLVMRLSVSMSVAGCLPKTKVGTRKRTRIGLAYLA
jgi:hypothetical protein